MPKIILDMMQQFYHFLYTLYTSQLLLFRLVHLQLPFITITCFTAIPEMVNNVTTPETQILHSFWAYASSRLVSAFHTYAKQQLK